MKESCGSALIEVQRTNGADGDISVKWRTHDVSAKSPKDFAGGEGILEFKHGEVKNLTLLYVFNYKVTSYNNAYYYTSDSPKY